MITFKKDGAVKFVSSDSTLIPTLRKHGWVAENELADDAQLEPVPPRRGRPPKIQEID